MITVFSHANDAPASRATVISRDDRLVRTRRDTPVMGVTVILTVATSSH